MFIILQPVRRGIKLQEEATNHKSEWRYRLHFSYLVSDWFSFAHNRQVRNISSVNGSLSFTVIASKLSIPMGELYPDLFQSQNKLYWAKSVTERTSEGKLHTSLGTEPSSQIKTFNTTITVMTMRGLIFAEFLHGFSFYISFAWNRSIKVNEEITHCDTIHKLTAKTRGQEKKRRILY